MDQAPEIARKFDTRWAASHNQETKDLRRDTIQDDFSGFKEVDNGFDRIDVSFCPR